MSIASKINEAREYITLLLQQFEEGALPTEAYSLERIRDRKVNWHCIKSSQILHNIPEDSFPQQTVSETEDNSTHVLRLPISKTMNNADDMPVMSSANSHRPQANYTALQQAQASAPREVDRVTSALPQSRSFVEDRDGNDPFGGAERLLMSGFAEVQTLLRQRNPAAALKRRNNPYVSLGELGIAEGWTTSVTNAAFCYDNNPAEGWRREVAIRMSGKSRGSIDIHYVTPDKTRRFRSKQDLQSYLSKINASSNFVNTFDFRTVFCLCHDNEDPSRSFLECSYGLAGCNKWLHPECIGLGRRSDKELELMPKVICPYCAAYLRGTGELAAFVTPDMLVMNELPACCSHASGEEEEDEDEIEESAAPHVLWGLQGSQYVYCSATQASGMDAFDEVFDVPAVAGSSNYRHQGYVGAAKENSSSSGSAQNAHQTDSAAELASSFLQHRLFQGGWASSGDGGEASGQQAPSEPVVVVVVPAEDVIPSDDDEGVPSNGAQLEPGDRVRRARHADDTTTMVRVDGGWMPRKKPRVESAPMLESPGDGAEGTGTSTTLAEEGGLTPEEEAERTRRVLAKAAEKGGAPFVSVSVRYKNEAIEAAVNAVQSSSHRKKATFSTSALTSIASATAVPQTVWSTNGTSQSVTELLEAYRINPSLCYLPMEDGGMRFTSVSFAPVPRSLHPLCIANLMCGYCMTYNGGETASQSAAAAAVEAEFAARSKAKKAKKPTTLMPPEFTRFALTSKAFGAVHYMVHKQCAETDARDVTNARNVVAVNDSTPAEAVITLGSVHEYEQAEDAECDLCGRKGGVLQYFHIHGSCSSIPPPTEDGWLAHIPCLHYLHSGNLLRPYVDQVPASSAAAGVDSNQAAFVSNPFSNDVGVGTYAIAQAVAIDSADREEASGSASAGSEDGEEHDDAAKERLQQQNRLFSRQPLSPFDQLFGQWRCAICGLQCGLTMRCVSAGCAVRVHPLCATTLQSPEWQLCSVEPERAHGQDGVQPAMCMLCPMHSAGLPK